MADLLRRPRFEEIANVVIADPYTIRLPERLRISLGDDLAASEFKETSATIHSDDLARITQAAYQHALRTGQQARSTGVPPTGGAIFQGHWQCSAVHLLLQVHNPLCWEALYLQDPLRLEDQRNVVQQKKTSK